MGKAGHRPKLTRDGDTDQVKTLNDYAVFMGYLSMAIKGLGFLVLTWTTVVLLGGFVSILRTNDFWCLTFITLVQTAGIFDVVLNEKLGYITKSFVGLIHAVENLVDPIDRYGSIRNIVCGFFLVGVQLLVIAAVLGPLYIIYVFGIVMSGGISLWRLFMHDYSDLEASNLGPAINTLYCLALLQAVIVCYKFICARGEERMVEREAFGVSMDIVANYLHETRRGCEMNPSFAKGRNLITHGIDMIGSTSPADCIFGVKVLHTAIFQTESNLRNTSKQHVLMKHLLLSASSSTDILKKLLEMLDSRGLHDRETRHKAAKIVGHLAFSISLEQFPQGIQHISSLIGTFGEYSRAQPYQRDCILEVFEHIRDAPFLLPSPRAESNLQIGYKTLLLRGQLILWRLASDENNCRVMSCTADLVSRIMAPVTSDLLHQTTDDHGEWSNIVQGSMEVMSQLTSAAGETGAKLRHEISSCKEAISTMEGILKCNKCNEKLQRRAIWILTQLYMDTESGRADFVGMLVDMFTQPSKPISVRGYAGGALSVLCFHGGISSATVVIHTSDDVVHSLIKVLLHDENKACRQAAAEILEHLCTHYTKDDERLGRLKEAMRDAMPKVIWVILDARAQTHSREKTQEDRFARPITDMQDKLDEIEWGKMCQGSRITPSDRISVAKYSVEIDKLNRKVKNRLPVWEANLLSSLLSLCATVYDRFIHELGPGLAPQFQESNFQGKLKQMLVEIIEPTVDNLLLFKAIAKMVISMTKQSGNRSINQKDLEILIDLLSSASDTMLVIDYSMLFRSTSRSETTPSRLDKCTLASLVKEARMPVHDRSTSVSD